MYERYHSHAVLYDKNPMTIAVRMELAMTNMESFSKTDKGKKFFLLFYSHLEGNMAMFIV